MTDTPFLNGEVRVAEGTGAKAGLGCVGLVTGYGDLEVVHGVSLLCAYRQVVAVIGPNGCGKSTTLKALAGLLPARGGTVSIDGEECTGVGAKRVSELGVHYIPQSRDVFPSLTVLENLLVGGTDRSRLDGVLGEFGRLAPILKRKAGRLSGGERKYVAIARAFMTPSLKVLVLDEPSAGLSVDAAAQLWRLVRECAERDVAVLVVEQAVEAVLQVADYAYVIVDGRNRAEGPAGGLRDEFDLGRLFMGM